MSGLHQGGTDTAKLLLGKGVFPSNVGEVELKGNELQLTALDSANKDKLVLLVFDSQQHCVVRSSA